MVFHMDSCDYKHGLDLSYNEQNFLLLRSLSVSRALKLSAFKQKPFLIFSLILE